VADMVAKLAKADELFKAPAAAGCKVESLSFSSENIPAELFGQYAAPEGEAENDHDHDHDGHNHDHDGDHSEEGEAAHGDIEAKYVFKCSEVGKLNSLEIALFSSFSSLEEVEARVVSDKGQSSQELTAGSTLLKW
jgi:hypothetical protein